MGIFNLDSPLFSALNKAFDVVILNLITVLCCLPIVTIGAAVTALYTATDRSQKEEGSLLRNYFKAFASNFKQATIIWLVLLVLTAMSTYSLLMSLATSAGGAMLLMSCVGLLLCAMFTGWAFPLQAKFENKVINTLRNAVIAAICYLPRTLLIVVMNAAPWVLLLLMPDLFLQLLPIWTLIWFGLAAWINWKLLAKPFRILIGEDEQKEEQE